MVLQWRYVHDFEGYKKWVREIRNERERTVPNNGENNISKTVLIVTTLVAQRSGVEHE